MKLQSQNMADRKLIQNTRIVQLKEAFGFVLSTNIKHFLEFKRIQFDTSKITTSISNYTLTHMHVTQKPMFKNRT